MLVCFFLSLLLQVLAVEGAVVMWYWGQKGRWAGVEEFLGPVSSSFSGGLVFWSPWTTCACAVFADERWCLSAAMHNYHMPAIIALSWLSPGAFRWMRNSFLRKQPARGSIRKLLPILLMSPPSSFAFQKVLGFTNR